MPPNVNNIDIYSQLGKIERKHKKCRNGLQQ